PAADGLILRVLFVFRRLPLRRLGLVAEKTADPGIRAGSPRRNLCSISCTAKLAATNPHSFCGACLQPILQYRVAILNTQRAHELLSVPARQNRSATDLILARFGSFRHRACIANSLRSTQTELTAV